eukprot:m.372270 g.372270  ORF g.372270 m.372270 type:complete len:475 (+) comp20870_c0_seq1:168-1592(+)
MMTFSPLSSLGRASRGRFSTHAQYATRTAATIRQANAIAPFHTECFSRSERSLRRSICCLRQINTRNFSVHCVLQQDELSGSRASIATTSSDSASKCPGCGVALQTTDISALGYISSTHLEALLAQQENTTVVEDLAASTEHAQRAEVTRVAPNTLQSDDGYAAAMDEAFELPRRGLSPRAQAMRAHTKAVVCERCHQLRYHRAMPTGEQAPGRPPAPTPADLAEDRVPPPIQSRTGTSQGGPITSPAPILNVVIVDLFDFHSSFGDVLNRVIRPGAPIMLVVNKVDVLPCDAQQNEQRLRRWVLSQPELETLQGEVVSINFVSGQTGWGLPRLLRRMYTHCTNNYTSARLIGITNAGKSTLINRMVVTGEEKQRRRGVAPVTSSVATRDVITTSAVAGTTVSALPFRLVMCVCGAAPYAICTLCVYCMFVCVRACACWWCHFVCVVVGIIGVSSRRFSLCVHVIPRRSSMFLL